tara:strand:+ start:113 stop:508 length:396 start_codon:yes stop_codon:yes gene_type:complete
LITLGETKKQFIMKKNLIFTLMLSLLAISTAFSQTVNDKPISEIDVEYIQIVGTAKLLSNKVKIKIDFGQLNKVFSAKDTQVKDKDGKLMVFNSMIDALNFFSANGYDFQQAYTITIGNQNVYHYLMKKKS